MNESYLNIDTADRAQYEAKPGGWRGLATDATRHRDNCAYGTPDYYYIFRIARILDPQPEDVIYDIGSGKGRILCVLGRRQVKKCVGIELFDELCAAARANAAKMRGRRSPIEIRCEDAAVSDVSDGTIYFLFNPFGRETLKDLVANIEKSLLTKPRKVRIVYYNSQCCDVFDSCDWLRRDPPGFRTINGLEIAFYENRFVANPLRNLGMN